MFKFLGALVSACIPLAASTAGTGLLPSMLPGPTEWKAHWIVGADRISGQNLMFLARRTFVLPSAPAGRAVLYVTADTRYQAFVNGAFVARGPSRSAAHHQSYDALDVARFLRPGTNVLALRFHHAGLASSYHQLPRPGLLVQLETAGAGATTTLGTDSSWKIILDPSWNTHSPRLNNWLDAFSDIDDLRALPAGWASVDFDDASWPAAASIVPGGVLSGGKIKALPTPQWWPMPEGDYLPHAVTPPWVSLVGREIPFLSEASVPATRLVGSGQVADRTSWPAESMLFTALPLLKLPTLSAPSEATFPLVANAQARQAAYHVFDLGRMHNGFPRLELEGPAGTVVDVLTAPYVLGDTLDPTIVNSLGADRIILSGQRDTWESFFFKPTRCLAVVVRGATGPVTLHAVGVTALAYPWLRRGAFTAPGNPWLEKFWRAGTRTIEAITTDAYTDNYRERRQYPQTSYYAARGNYAAFGDTFLQRRYLVQNAGEQEPDGTLGAFAPISDGRYMPFLDAQFFWLMGWRDYHLYSGDEASVRRLLPAARRVLERLATLAGPDGLIVDPPYPYWIDHAHLDRRGAHFTVNALYLLTLEECAQTYDWLGEPGGPGLREAAARIRTRLQREFWSADHGLFAEARVAGELSDRFSEHANAIAVVAAIASPEQTRTILPKLLKPDAGLVPATSLFTYWTMAALCKTGRVDEALAMLERRFAHQLAPNTNGTLWEEWHLDRTFRRGFREKNSRADAQGECGIFPEAITRWVVGLEPTAPGQRAFTLRRPATRLSHTAATWPAPSGNLDVAWTAGGLTLSIPPGTTVHLDLTSLHAAPGSIRVDDAVPADEASSKWAITEGRHRVTFQTRRSVSSPHSDPAPGVP